MYFSNKNIVSFVLLITLLTVPLILKAADDKNIQKKILKLNEDILKIIEDPNKKIDIEVKKKLYVLADHSEIFDWDVMTCHVITKEKYQMASPKQRVLLTENFKKIFIIAYSIFVKTKQVKEQKFSSFVSFNPVENSCGYEISAKLQADFGKTNDVLGGNSVVYLLSESKAPKVWKLVEVKSNNIYILSTFKEQFQDITGSNGLDGLIEKLQVKNSH